MLVSEAKPSNFQPTSQLDISFAFIVSPDIFLDFLCDINHLNMGLHGLSKRNYI